MFFGTPERCPQCASARTESPGGACSLEVSDCGAPALASYGYRCLDCGAEWFVTYKDGVRAEAVS